MNQTQKKRNCKHKQQIQKVKYPEHVRCAGADEDCSSATEEFAADLLPFLVGIKQKSWFHTSMSRSSSDSLTERDPCFRVDWDISVVGHAELTVVVT